MAPATGQAWSPVFNHNEEPGVPTPSSATYTNPYVPWGAPAGVAANMNPPAGMQLLVPWLPPDPTRNNRMFNAVHMALIPKGPYQGMVLVWDIFPVITRDPTYAPPHAAGTYRSFQPYAIIDPTGTPTVATPNDPAVRFRNRLLAIGPIFTPGVEAPANLFCSGHTWSNFGDLIVVGGTRFVGAPVFQSLDRTFAWNADRVLENYPGTVVQMYPGFGLWVEGQNQNLTFGRWYPTAVLTHPLPRVTEPITLRRREVVIVAGGSDVDPANAGCAPGPGTQPTWNSVESLVIDSIANPTSAGFFKDAIGPGVLNPSSQFVADGPGTPGGPPDIDWMEEYPRFHQLSNRRLFFSGYGTRWAWMDPELAPITMFSWTKAPSAPFSSNWQFARHDAPSLLFPNLSDGDADRIVRLGGADTHFYYNNVAGTTDTMESIDAAAPTPSWQTEPAMPIVLPAAPPYTGDEALFGSRYLFNAVVMPTGGIFVVGGSGRLPNQLCNQGEMPHRTPLLFAMGTWTTLPASGSIRGYHSTAVLLPDGRVFVGGGNDREYDYQIFSPAYRTNATLLAQKPSNVAFGGPVPFFDPRFDAFELAYGSAATFMITFAALPTGVSLDRVVLMAPASLTHHSDMAARYHSLPVTGRSSTSVKFTGPELTSPPTGPEIRGAPRGIYMLFLVTNTGAVSDALWVFLP